MNKIVKYMGVYSMMCGKCFKCGGLLFLIVGILLLLQNLNVWNFWGIQWYSAFFIIIGLGSLFSGCCKECKTVRGETKKR